MKTGILEAQIGQNCKFSTSLSSHRLKGVHQSRFLKQEFDFFFLFQSDID